MVKAQRVVVPKQYFDDSEHSSKVILDELLQGVGGKLILCCNFDVRKLPIYIPVFCTECLYAWMIRVNINVHNHSQSCGCHQYN